MEKREMLKENKRMKKQLYKEEKQRVTKLVNIAYALDPRVKLWKLLLEQRKKDQKIADKQQKQKEREEHQQKMRDNTVNLRAVEIQVVVEVKVDEEE